MLFLISFHFYFKHFVNFSFKLTVCLFLLRLIRLSFNNWSAPLWWWSTVTLLHIFAHLENIEGARCRTLFEAFKLVIFYIAAACRIWENNGWLRTLLFVVLWPNIEEFFLLFSLFFPFYNVVNRFRILKTWQDPWIFVKHILNPWFNLLLFIKGWQNRS